MPAATEMDFRLDTTNGVPNWEIWEHSEAVRRFWLMVRRLSTWGAERWWAGYRDRLGDDVRVWAILTRIHGDLYACDDCDGPYRPEDGFGTRDGDVCGLCRDNYFVCEDCDDTYHNDDGCDRLGRMVCHRCADNNYSMCNNCNEEYAINDGPSCDCGDESNPCDCMPHATEFQFPNDGQGPIASDVAVTIELPAGTISETGIFEIKCYLRYKAEPLSDRVAYHAVGDLDPQWIVSKGKICGNYTKRLAKLAWQQEGVKLSPETISAVGNLARQHSGQESEYTIEVTRKGLNDSADAWVYGGSCWWGEYTKGRCALKTAGGLGIRGEDGDGRAIRAWILPLDASLRPTAETLLAHAYLVFNGYRENEDCDEHPDGYTLSMARLVSHMAGKSYGKVAFRTAEMYVNDGCGYLVADAETIERQDTLELSFSIH